MNFISHYFCAKEAENPYYTLGVMVPDMFKKFSFYHNKFFNKFDTALLSPSELKIWQGIEQHYADDAYFHDLASFKQGMTIIEEEMATFPSTENIQRKFLISHVLYELILDNMILDRHPQIVSGIYEKIEKIQKAEIQTFFEKIIGKHSEIDLFLESYDRFMERRFLNFYAEEPNLVKALHRVTGSIGKWEYNLETESAFLSIIKRIKLNINFDLEFDNIKSHKRSH